MDGIQTQGQSSPICDHGPASSLVTSHQLQGETTLPLATSSPPPASAVLGQREVLGTGSACWTLGWLTAAKSQVIPSGDVPKHPGLEGSPVLQVSRADGQDQGQLNPVPGPQLSSVAVGGASLGRSGYRGQQWGDTACPGSITSRA